MNLFGHQNGAQRESRTARLSENSMLSTSVIWAVLLPNIARMEGVLDMPSQTHRASGGLTAGSCGPFLFGCNSDHGARRLHGSGKFAGAGSLWMRRGVPFSSVVGQSLCMRPTARVNP